LKFSQMLTLWAPMISRIAQSRYVSRLTAFALHDEPWVGLDELLALVDAVSREQVAALAHRYLHPDRQLVMRLGPV